jgi:hypothetical protein
VLRVFDQHTALRVFDQHIAQSPALRAPIAHQGRELFSLCLAIGMPVPMPFAPKSPSPRLREPSATNADITLFSGKLYTPSVSHPRGFTSLSCDAQVRLAEEPRDCYSRRSASWRCTDCALLEDMNKRMGQRRGHVHGCAVMCSTTTSPFASSALLTQVCFGPFVLQCVFIQRYEQSSRAKARSCAGFQPPPCVLCVVCAGCSCVLIRGRLGLALAVGGAFLTWAPTRIAHRIGCTKSAGAAAAGG